MRLWYRDPRQRHRHRLLQEAEEEMLQVVWRVRWPVHLRRGKVRLAIVVSFYPNLMTANMEGTQMLMCATDDEDNNDDWD